MSPLFTMPVPPAETSADLPYYQAFIHCMHEAMAPFEMGFMSHEAMAVRIRDAIEVAAQSTGTSPAHIARLLVAYGLRAPQEAFPSCFIGYVEATARLRPGRAARVPDQDVNALHRFWNISAASVMHAA